MTTFKKALGDVRGDSFIRKVRDLVRAETGDGVKISGHAMLSVKYSVRATVRVEFDEITLRDEPLVSLTYEGGFSDPESFKILPQRTDKTDITGDEIAETIESEVGYDIPEDLDDYNVEIEWVEVEDHDVDSVELDSTSEAAIEAYNSSIEEEEGDVSV